MRRFFTICAFLSITIFANHHAFAFHSKAKVARWLKHGTTVQNLVENGQIPHVASKRALFVFDLDDTLVSGNYKGDDRFEHVQLKPWVREAWLAALSQGHFVGVATFNVREVTDFLMKELKLDWNNPQARLAFAKTIFLEQPTMMEKDIFTKSRKLPEGKGPTMEREYRGGVASKLVEGAAELFKNSKGDMVQKMLDRIEQQDSTVHFVVFSDDKLRFHKQVLKRDYTHHKKPISVLGLLVGQRGPGIKPTSPEHPSQYINHLKLVEAMALSAPLLSRFIQAAGAKPALLVSKQIDHLTELFPVRD